MFAYFIEMRGLKKVVLESHRHEGKKFLIMYNRRTVDGKTMFFAYIKNRKQKNKTMFFPQNLVQKRCLERTSRC